MTYFIVNLPNADFADGSADQEIHLSCFSCAPV